MNVPLDHEFLIRAPKLLNGYWHRAKRTKVSGSTQPRWTVWGFYGSESWRVFPKDFQPDAIEELPPILPKGCRWLRI